MATTTADVSVRSRPMTAEERKVILASSAGTIFEWYDFYLYGSLAAMIGAQFFTPFPEATRNVFALLAFAAGFIVRPFGALVFGSLGDIIGRKYTFLMTILIMGLSTFIVGLLPNYYSWGIAAPIILIGLRMLQGLALGGEYGGAAVYVAEHAPQNRRGYYTAFIQTTATLGLLLSLIVIISVQGYVNGAYPDQPVLNALGEIVKNADGSDQMQKAFNAWGWRIPFLGSIFLLLISLYIRLQMNESPAFKKMKEEGAASKAPLREAFGNWKNGKIAIIALLGLTAGQAVVWYSGQFYALFFMQNVIKVDSFTANVFVAWSLILGTGGFLFFGSLSDRIGRKPIILAGCLIAAITYFPVFSLLTKTANPMLYAAQQTDVTVTADPADCSFQFNPTGIVKFTNSCDIAKAKLYSLSVNSTTVDAAAGEVASIKIGETLIPAYNAAANTADIAATKAKVDAAKAAIDAGLMTALDDADKALAGAKATVAAADKALKAAADDAAKATAQTALDAANAAVAQPEAAVAAARAAIPADLLATLDAAKADAAKAAGVKGGFDKAVADALTTAGYPIVAKDNTTVAKAEHVLDIFTGQKISIILILTYLIILVTMVYGPIAALLVELYPTRIRYSGLSLPYHIGNGWFGGLLPATAFAISAQAGNIYTGLWYAISVAVMTVIIGTIFVPNGTHKKSIFTEA
jgi:MFS family permease